MARSASAILIGLVSLFLAGCSARTVEVKVPVAVPCIHVVPAKPSLPIKDLSATSPPDQVVKKYAETVSVLKQAVIERDQILERCSK